jgi:hypothetical protein
MYLIIIDTNKYSGNFERAMCAYITGVVGECGTCEKCKDIALKELNQETIDWFEDNVVQVPDEHGVLRPCAIRPTPGWFNDGVGNNWRDGADPQEVKWKKIESVTKYYTPLVERAKANIAKGNTQWERDLKGYVARMKEAVNNDVVKYDAYQSVAIFFKTLPTEDLVKHMVYRAKKFCTKENIPAFIGNILEDITVDGFRLIHSEEIETTILKG